MPSLVLVDTATGRLRADLGAGMPVAIGHGVVVWALGCDPAGGPCTLRRRAVAGHRTTSYTLPRPPAFGAGALSSTGWALAFPLQRAAADPRYAEAGPMPPTDVALLNLRTGALAVVPGIELPAKVSPALAFTPDGRWLVIALNAGNRIRLLAWRAPLRRAYESTSIRYPGWDAPPILAQSSSSAG